jgi:hypothetical protein
LNKLPLPYSAKFSLSLHQEMNDAANGEDYSLDYKNAFVASF